MNVYVGVCESGCVKVGVHVGVIMGAGVDVVV